MTPLSFANDDNNSNNDVAIDISIGSESPGGTAGDGGHRNSMKLEQTLFAVGLCTLMTVINRIASMLPPGTIFERHQVAYYILLFGIFLAGVAEVYVGASLLQSGQDGGRGRAYVVPILCASVVLLAATVALGGSPVLVMV